MGSYAEKIGGQNREIRVLMNFSSHTQNQKIWLIVLSLSVLVLTTGVAVAQQSDGTESRQTSLLARLSSGNEEQRADCVVELGSLLSVYPAEQGTVDALSNLLQRDSSPMVRALAARAMEFSRDERFSSALLAGLKNERDISVRKATIYALAFQRSPQIVGVLLTLLKDKKQEIRAASAFALAEIGDPISKDSLIDLLKKRGKDEDIFARSQAARGLGKMPDQSTIEALTVSLNRDKSQEVRRFSASSLGLIASSQNDKAVEALKSAKLNSDPYLVLAAEAALVRVNSRNP
jgi:HEAT repeat protein